MEKLSFKDVTLICVTDVHIPQSLYALEICKYYADFFDIKLLTSKDIPDLHIQIHPLKTLEEYSNFVLEELNNYIESPYCLLVHWDGFILNPDAWTDEFLKYDYIGAPMFPCNVVGNGGFSLRSKKLMTFIQESTKFGFHKGTPEDAYICQTMRSAIESNGMKIAPLELAKKFSVEGKWEGSFGFHNLHLAYNLSKDWERPLSHVPVMCPMCNSAKEWHVINGGRHQIVGLHSGDMGDIIYALPIIKKLGIEYLMLNINRSYGTNFNIDQYWKIKPLIESQGIEVGVNSENVIVDYYLDAFRRFPIQTASQHLIHSQAYPLGVDIDTTQKFIELPKVEKDIDIVINKTKRYNSNVNYRNLLLEFKDKKIVFIGLKEEYEDFKKWKIDIEYKRTNNLLEVAELINRSKVFIGNQSSCFAIAEGIKANRILECCAYTPNSNPQTSNGYMMVDNGFITYAIKLIRDWLC